MIALSDRVIALGDTGTGKSEAIAALWAQSRRQRILVDVPDHYELGPAALEEGALEVDKVADIDWGVRTLRYVPRGGKREYEDLFAAIFDRADLDVWLDEAYGPTTAHHVPVYLRRVATQGRKKRIRLMATNQRPVNVMPELIDQAEHALIFPLYRPDDLDSVAQRIGMQRDELATALHSLPRVQGIATAQPSGYLVHRKGVRELVRMPPLPLEVIEQTRRHIRNPS